MSSPTYSPQPAVNLDSLPWLAAVALANKTARIAWAVLTRGGNYAAPTAA